MIVHIEFAVLYKLQSLSPKPENTHGFNPNSQVFLHLLRRIVEWYLDIISFSVDHVFSPPDNFSNISNEHLLKASPHPTKSPNKPISIFNFQEFLLHRVISRVTSTYVPLRFYYSIARSFHIIDRYISYTLVNGLISHKTPSKKHACEVFLMRRFLSFTIKLRMQCIWISNAAVSLSFTAARNSMIRERRLSIISTNFEPFRANFFDLQKSSILRRNKRTFSSFHQKRRSLSYVLIRYSL